MTAGQRSAGAEPFKWTFVADFATGCSRAGTQIDDVIGDGDRFWLVLDDKDRVPLVTELQQEIVHAPDVVRVEPDGWLIEDVGDISQGRAEVPDHAGALGFATGERSRGPIQREIAKPDVDEGVKVLAQRVQQWSNGRLVQAADPFRQVADLHGAGIGNADAPDLR